jgi:hypothetical protein
MVKQTTWTGWVIVEIIVEIFVDLIAEENLVG